MKLFIKKYTSLTTEVTWWVYYCKDGKGYAINAFYKYLEARNALMGHIVRDGESAYYTDRINKMAQYHKDSPIYRNALIIDE